MRTILEDILYGRRHDLATLPLRALLWAFSLLYGVAVVFRAFLYGKGWLKTERVPCRVVSIGNITVGGTGKTPVVIMTARMLRETGQRVVVVSRGYGRDSGALRVVSDGSKILLSAVESGDEPHLIASALPGVPVVVGTRRPEAARLAWERFRPDVILLDDAFQHQRLRRDTDIVTLDAANPFGCGHILPRGTLREPPRAIARAQAVLITRCEDDSRPESLECRIEGYHSGIPVFRERHVPVALRALPDGEKMTPGSIKGRRIGALSNIAVPDSFHHTLEALGAVIVRKYRMPDHHRYRSGELEEIVRDAETGGADFLVMTAKDERNLPGDYMTGPIKVLVLDIEAVLIADHDAYLELVAPTHE